jgi:hypothetical protein
MREIHPDLAPHWRGGLLQAVSVDGGPTDEQLRIILGLLRGSFGGDGTLDLRPLPAHDVARVIALDHLALADEPLETLRSQLGIPPRAA